MALSTESANLVWQKAFVALQSLGAKPSIVDSLRRLKEKLATVNANPDLQFVTMADITGDTVIADAACKLYAIFVKKQATATDAYFKTNDHATTCGAANGASMTDCVWLPDSGDQHLFVFPNGRAQANGITVASQTTAPGNTDNTSGDGPNGFVILGKP